MNKVSMVIACLALLVSTAGGAYAGVSSLIGSKQIKDHSVNLVDLSSSTVKALKGQRGPQGPMGPMGPQGFAGSAGVAGVNGINGKDGGFDPDKVSYLAGDDVVIAAGEADAAFAVCPAGNKVVGGGGYENLGEAYASAPAADGTAWVYVVDNITASPITVNAYAVCAAK
jgi:hypothetical protein